mmetsp:Transcript_26781/g.62659  ORF Transcript_26781/g.62659 Transcript_26781/m.62659 type:complete len:227 (+) Transcript_26781:3007-3687(+)
MQICLPQKSPSTHCERETCPHLLAITHVQPHSSDRVVVHRLPPFVCIYYQPKARCVQRGTDDEFIFDHFHLVHYHWRDVHYYCTASDAQDPRRLLFAQSSRHDGSPRPEPSACGGRKTFHLSRLGMLLSRLLLHHWPRVVLQQISGLLGFLHFQPRAVQLLWPSLYVQCQRHGDCPDSELGLYRYQQLLLWTHRPPSVSQWLLLGSVLHHAGPLCFRRLDRVSIHG